MDELGQALLAFDADAAIGCIPVTGSEKLLPLAPNHRHASYSFADAWRRLHITRNWETMPPRAQAGDCRRQRLCTGGGANWP